MITFITDTQAGETPFPHEAFQCDLRIVNLFGVELTRVSVPEQGWTHHRLSQLSVQLDVLTGDGADAYLGDHWVGSTEV